MPIVEFLGAGKPAICNRNTAIPEVGGTDVMYVEDDPQSVAMAMKEVANAKCGEDSERQAGVDAHLEELIARNRSQFEETFEWIDRQLK